MPLAHLSYPSTDQVEQFSGSDWSADSASGGNRISIQYCVVIFLLFDLLTMAGVGFLVTEVGASYGLYPSTAIDNQALTIGVALFLFIVLAFSVGASICGAVGWNVCCVTSGGCSGGASA